MENKVSFIKVVLTTTYAYITLIVLSIITYSIFYLTYLKPQQDRAIQEIYDGQTMQSQLDAAMKTGMKQLEDSLKNVK